MEQTEKNTVIASRCPECGAIIADRIDISALQNEEFMVKCKICGKSNLTVRKDYDGKIRLNIPCLVCAHQHPYTLGSSSFFEKELFLLQCSYSGLDICFIGTEDKVDKALRASARQLKELFSENKNQETDNNFLDINIMQEVMYAVEELAITNRIRCSCGEPNLAITVEYDKVHISCKDCGDKATLFASEKSDIDTAVNLKKLILSRP